MGYPHDFGTPPYTTPRNSRGVYEFSIPTWAWETSPQLKQVIHRTKIQHVSMFGNQYTKYVEISMYFYLFCIILLKKIICTHLPEKKRLFGDNYPCRNYHLQWHRCDIVVICPNAIILVYSHSIATTAIPPFLLVILYSNLCWWNHMFALWNPNSGPAELY